MKRFLPILCLTFLACFSNNIVAQCDDGKTNIFVSVTTDDYGYESYWEITDPSGAILGSAGCDLIKPGGNRIQSSGEINNCSELLESGLEYIVPVCVPLGVDLTFTMYDDWGDGMCCDFGEGSFSILGSSPLVNGGTFTASSSHTFQAQELPRVTDVALTKVDLPNAVVEGQYPIAGGIKNEGTVTVTSIDINWSVSNGSVYTRRFTNLELLPFASMNFEHLTNWSAVAGQHVVDVWISNVNGVADENVANDKLVKDVLVTQELGRMEAVIEHFTQASCGPCAVRNPDFDAMIADNIDDIAPIKYHTSWPGVDPMYNENPDDPDARVGYYGISGVPSAMIQGTVIAGIVPDDLSAVVDATKFASLFTLDVNESLVDGGGAAKIDITLTAKATLDVANLRLHVVAVEDMVEYANPPGSNGEEDFPYVMRKMLAGATGELIGNQPIGNVETLSYTYEFPQFVDPTAMRTVIFIQNQATREIHLGYMTETAMGTAVETNKVTGQSLGVNFAITPESCPGAGDGSIETFVTNTIFPATFNWTDNSTDRVREELTSGEYTVEVIDGEGIVETYTVWVPGSEEFAGAVVETTEEVAGNDGSATIEVTGGQAPYTITWNNNQTGATLTGVNNGEYTATIVDANGCTFAYAVGIGQEVGINDPIVTLSQNYPNPADKVTFVELGNVNQKVQLTVTDVTGKVVINQVVEAGTSKVEVNTSALSNGTYFYQLRDNSEVLTTKKMIVLH